MGGASEAMTFDHSTASSDVFAHGGEIGRMMASTDWSKTPLGHPSTWPQALRTTVALLLRNRFPMVMWWGPELRQFYNDAYVPILGDKHPRALTQKGSDCWAEIWHIIGPMVVSPFSGGPATGSEDLLLLINRKGFFEESHFKFAYSPVPDDTVSDTGVGGVLATVAEITEQVYAERQLKTLRELAASAAHAKTPAQACRTAAFTFEGNPFDVPFALFYLLERDGARAWLASSCGFASTAGPANPDIVDLKTPSDDRAWPIAHVVRTASIEVVDDLAERFYELPRGRWTASAHSALVVPLASPGQPRPYGVLVVGCNPHRSLDEGYRGFFELAAAQVVTAIRNANEYEEQRLRAEKLSEIDRAKTAFFSNVSHEFRTPLTLMLGPLEDALSSPERVLGGENLEAAYRNSRRLLKLVNTLLDFSRIEAGRLQANYEPVDLCAYTEDLAGVFRAAIERAGLKLVVRCEALDAPVFVDREMWEKVVLNLVSNAFKFTFEGEIEVALRGGDDHVELTVSDTGVGVPAHEVKRLFERFHRVEGVRSRTHEGSGIGLALVQELVRLHGGEISATSEPGVGSIFTVRIPRGSDHLPRERIVPAGPRPLDTTRASLFLEEALHWLHDSIESGAPASEPSASEPPTASTARRERVLVVDDNADLREYLQRILESRWTVETAPDGEAALRAVRASPPDLVLTDVMMPGLSGFGLLAELKGDPRTRRIPVVMLSARAGEEAKVEGLDAGADDYLTKPFSAKELVARVASQLSLGASHRERDLLLQRERSARREAELQRQHLFSLFMQAPTPIVILRGPDYVIDLANPPACQVVGLREEEVVGRPAFAVTPELEDQGFRELLDTVMTTGEPYIGKETPLRLDRPSQQTPNAPHFNFVFAPLRDVDDKVDGVLVFAFDVTDEVMARNQVEELRRQAEAANRAKDEFLAMLGHELRNPLAPMLTALQLMRLRGVESREQDILERQVGHLTRLVDDLLDVSRITRGKIELRKREVELADAVVSALEISSPLLEQRGHHVEVQVPREGLVVSADPGRLAQVISNLLTNAAKYSEAGSKILVTAEQDGDRVRIRVKDRGVGIPAEQLDSVFERFVQQPQTLDRSKGGLGLGLAIVRNLVELHGGTVHAKSEGLGKGSEFIVELPVVDLIEPAEETTTVRETKKPARPLGRRILVVDDNPDAVELLKDALEALGYTVEAAHDGPQALKAAETFKPEIALLDIGLPVMDGYELARRLRSLAGLPPDLQLVAVTGYGQEADRRRSADAGFALHLVKPLDLSKLGRVVEGLRS
jgi:PAS domain S-box-containing protein